MPECYNLHMEIHGIEAMDAESVRLAGTLVPRTGSATILALSGDLGAGKTTFAQGIARSLGVAEQVTSPTFVIEKIYQLENQKFSRLIHIDAYRLNDAHELEVLGWKEITADPANLIVIEWPEKVAGLIPEDAIRLSFRGSGDSREISYF
jgi:tRNA threonylcarbamoyl adenosine modification protein YjeE